MNPLLPWLEDAALVYLSTEGAVNPSIWALRYDATCPSEFYRGYATLLVRIANALLAHASMQALGQYINAYHQEAQTLLADQRRSGVDFALTNVACYAENGTMAQIGMTLGDEIVVIANCFLQNQAAGL
jgi:hypothetical protein